MVVPNDPAFVEYADGSEGVAEYALPFSSIVPVSYNSSSSGWGNSTQYWLTGSSVNINTILSGYTNDTLSFTPIAAGDVKINISLIPDPATTVGTSIGGIVRDNVYSNPIPDATVTLKNTTYGDYITKTTNIAGYYRADSLHSGGLYDVWSSKTGYGNSTVAQKLAVGV